MTSPKVARAALLALTLCIGSTAWSADLAFAPNTFRLPHGLVSRASPRSVCSSSGERRPALLGAFPSPGAALLRNPLLAPGVCGLRAPVALRAKASTIEAEEAVVDSLVLLKGAPVVVQSVDENDPEKVEVLQLNSRTKKAKAKDLRMMFPGPVRSWELQELSGDLPVASMPLPEARLVLEKERGMPLGEFAQLLFGETTHLTTWAAWKMVEDGLYFHGDPSRVYAYPESKIANQLRDEARMSKEKSDFAGLIERLKSRQLAQADYALMDSVQDVAMMRANSSAVMKGAGMSQTPEQAHDLLLELGIWEKDFNPWPGRFKVNMDSPSLAVPAPDAKVARVDLTHLQSFAIDQEGTSDPDDAISIEKDGKKVWVHVADASAVVSKGSPLLTEARARAASLYAPTGTVPMLPSAAAASLGLGIKTGKQPALSFGFTVDDDGDIANVEVVRSHVNVQRLTYEEATKHIDAGEEVWASLDAAASRFKQRRESNGAVGFQFPEAEVLVKPDGAISVAELEAFESKDVVMEFMLMAGEASSQFAIDNEIPLLYASQAAPIDQKTGKPFPVKPPGTLSQMFDLMKRMSKSEVNTAPGFHFGLGMGMYSQVTSPLRRYGDLLNHIQIGAFLDGQTPFTGEQLLAQMDAIAAKSQAVKKTERFSRQWYTLLYLKDHEGWEGEGVVLSTWQSKPLAPKVATVLIVELGLFASVKLRKETRKDDYIPVKLQEVKLVDMRANFIHNVEPGQTDAGEKAEKYIENRRSRKIVGTRLHSNNQRSG